MFIPIDLARLSTMLDRDRMDPFCPVGSAVALRLIKAQPHDVRRAAFSKTPLAGSQPA